MSDPAPLSIEVRGLRKAYGGLEAVRGVDFTVGRGEIFGLLGPNGAGKTTIVECLVGLRDPDAGDLFVCGLDARRQPREVKRRIGVALQSTSLQDKITPREALRLFGALYGGGVAADELLARFDLGAKADAALDTLSGGQRQRLAIARALLLEPTVLLLDDPTSAIDPETEREILEAMEAAMEGRTTFIVAHRLATLRSADRILVLERGRLAQVGTHDSLMAEDGPYRRAIHVQTEGGARA